jgi:hypothetical protein
MNKILKRNPNHKKYKKFNIKKKKLNYNPFQFVINLNRIFKIQRKFLQIQKIHRMKKMNKKIMIKKKMLNK